MIVCVCNGISDKEIVDAIEEGICTYKALQKELGISTNCGSCAKSIQLWLDGCSDSNGSVNHHIEFKPAFLNAV